MNLPTHLDRFLDEPCEQCGRPFMWCECGFPPYFSAAALRGDTTTVLELLDRLAADQASPQHGRQAVLRIWAAFRRARGWE